MKPDRAFYFSSYKGVWGYTPFNILTTFAEFEADLIRMRTREGMAIARAKRKLRGKQPKLTDKQQNELRRMYDTGDYSISDLAELCSVSRPTALFPVPFNDQSHSLEETGGTRPG